MKLAHREVLVSLDARGRLLSKEQERPKNSRHTSLEEEVRQTLGNYLLCKNVIMFFEH